MQQTINQDNMKVIDESNTYTTAIYVSEPDQYSGRVSMSFTRDYPGSTTSKCTEVLIPASSLKEIGEYLVKLAVKYSN